MRLQSGAIILCVTLAVILVACGRPAEDEFDLDALLQEGLSPQAVAVTLPAPLQVATQSVPPITSMTASATATLEPTATATLQSGQTGPFRISFAPGAISTTERGTVGPGSRVVFRLFVLQGQTMTVKLDSFGGATLGVLGLSDDVIYLADDSGAVTWSGLVPRSQDYDISVIGGSQAGGFTLEIIIPPLE